MGSGRWSGNCSQTDLGKIGIKPADGGNCKDDNDCCCLMQTCQTQSGGGYSQCKTTNPWPSSGNFLTHYWDCCKPSCARAAGRKGIQTTSCTPDGNYNNPTLDPSMDNPDTNICANQGEKGSMCKAQIPWIDNGVLYGYAAVSGQTPDCGDCYELELNGARGVDKAVVMITNGGDSDQGNFDLAVPGGGFGQFNGCLYGGTNSGNDMNWKEWNVKKACNDHTCIQYGGFTDQQQCEIAFQNDPISLKACNEVLFGVFGQMGCNIGQNPASLSIKSSTKVTCPQQLKNGNPAAKGPVVP